MAIIRRRNFETPSHRDPNDIALIDTPEKLLQFAQRQELKTIPLDVTGVAKKLGIRIKHVSLKGDLSGIFYKDEENNSWVMCINKNHHPNRQRYTIAHELGHFCLHRHFKHVFEDKIFFRGGKSSKVEWQANDFASAILMPEREFRNTVEEDTRKIDEVAKKFRVSTLALRIRAKNLGMSGHGL